MGGRVSAYEDSGEVFLRGFISSVRGRSNSAIQELDSPSFLPGSNVRRDSKLSGRGIYLDYRILCGLSRHGVRYASEEIRPLGRRIDSHVHAKTCKSGYIKTRISNKFVRTREL